MIKFYRNLNIGGWSYKDGKAPVDHCNDAILYNVKFKQPSGQAFEDCINGGHRAVFAWFKGQEIWLDSNDLDNVSIDGLSQLFFNPKKGDTFFHIRRNGKKVRVDSTPKAVFFKDGRTFVEVV